MTKREIMVKAHEYAKEIKGNYAVAMSYGLKKAWSESKLPILVGSEKQISWATDIRNSNIKAIERELADFERRYSYGDSPTFITIIEKLRIALDDIKGVKSPTAAKFWIEHKNVAGAYIQKIKR